MSAHEAVLVYSLNRANALTIESVRPRPRCIDYTSPASSKPAPRERRRATVAPRMAGAVRIDASAPPPKPSRHLLKVGAGLTLVASGILVTTASIGTVTPAGTSAEATRTVKRVEPTFYFDDATDALGKTALDNLALNNVAQRFTAQRKTDLNNTAQGNTARSNTVPGNTALNDMATGEAAPGETALSKSAHATYPPTDAPADDSKVADPSPILPVVRQPVAEAVEPAALTRPAIPVLATPDNFTLALASTSAGTSLQLPGDLRVTASDSEPTRVDYRIVSGDTLSGVLNDHGVRIEQMPALLGNDIVKKHLSNLDIGQMFRITQLDDGRFHSLSTKVGKDLRVTIRAERDDFAIAAIDLPLTRERMVTSGSIEQSLYLAAEKADLKQSTIMALADIFQWELDFARDIRQGDHFAVIYDRLFREGEYIGDGEILAAEFVRGGRTYRAIRFTDENGDSNYYSPDGTSKRRTFLRHPVDVVRITSKFNPKRLHPVLHQIRAHRGVDYGSQHGSPIRATADGVVKVSGNQNAYGNMVILQHGGKIKTLYAHMSRISDKSVVGHRVKQGDVIGYVGNTGRVTGTHLHYEFRVNDKHVDPLTIELPAAAPVAAQYRDALMTLSESMINEMRRFEKAAGEQVAAHVVGTSD